MIFPLDAGPLLMLDGEIIEEDSNITFGSIQVKGQALLCVIPNKHCCDTEGTVTAEFLYPNGTYLSAYEGCTDGMYITRGKHIVRLNHASGLAEVFPPAGSYCCSVSTGDGTEKRTCVNLQP